MQLLFKADSNAHGTNSWQCSLFNLFYGILDRSGTEIKQDVTTNRYFCLYEGWNFNSGNYLFTTDTK